MKLSRLLIFSHLSHCAAVGILAALFDVYETAMESAWLTDSVKTHLEAGNKVI